MTIKVALAGAGAFGIKHLDAIKLIDGVEVVSLVSRELEKTKETASKYGISHVTTDLADERSRSEMSSSKERTSGVHGRTGEACPRADEHGPDTIRAVEYSGYTVNYCPSCQTGGKILADNTTSKFLK